MSAAIHKYGEANFTIEKIDEAASTKELSEKEVLWIEKLGTMSPGGYNLTYGGEGTKPGEETREKLRKAFLGRKISEEHRQKISSALKGRKMPEEKLQKMLGKGLTEQHRRKISKGLLNHEVSEKTRMRIRKSKQGKPRRPHSEESKQRIREGVLRYWRNKNEKTESVTRTS